MPRLKSIWIAPLVVVLALTLFAAACGTTTTTTTVAPSTSTTAIQTTTTTAAPPVTLLVGGTFALTGAYAEDCAAVLAGFTDYVKYVNDNHIIAPWATDQTIPTNITFKLVYGDDGLAADKTLTIYDDLKSQGLLVERVSGSPEGMALKDKLIEDQVGATSQSTSPAYLTPDGCIFTNAPIYTDEMAAIGQWFMENWKDTTRKPNLAYLTADSTLGRNIDIPELQTYLTGLGFNFVGEQYVPMVPTAAPTTQLAWLKDNKVDLAVGLMINPGSQPTIKEAVRLGMGTDQAYKITFAFGNPAHLQIFVPAMGESGNGVVVAGDFCALDADVDGVKFAKDVWTKYESGKTWDPNTVNVMYLDGIIECMTQIEALRLACQSVDPSKLTSADVLTKGFQQIKDLSTGGITISNLTYGAGDTEGVDQCRLQQVQAGKIVELGAYPLQHIVAAKK